MEKIAIFSSGSLTYLSTLTDTPPPSTPTYPATSLLFPPTLCLPFLSPLPPYLYCLLIPQQWVSLILLFHPLSLSIPPHILGLSIQCDLMCVH